MSVLVERLKKKNAPGGVYKGTAGNKSFFKKHEIFVVTKIAKKINGKFFH